MWPMASEMLLGDIIVWYDGPQLYIAVNEDNDLYAIVHVGEIDKALMHGDWWMYVKLSRERYGKFMDGKITYHDLFSDPEETLWYWENEADSFCSTWCADEYFPQGVDYVTK